MKADPVLKLIETHADRQATGPLLRRIVHDINGPLAAISMDNQLLVRRRQRLADRIAHLDPGSATLLRDMSSVLDNIAAAAKDMREYLEAVAGAVGSEDVS